MYHSIRNDDYLRTAGIPIDVSITEKLIGVD
jgi:hypothetical protein